MATSFSEVYDSFESSFQDKKVIPESLEKQWLKKAVARFEIELGDNLSMDTENDEFSGSIPQYVIDTLAAYMKQCYQEREVSKVNKRVSIVGSDVSIDGGGRAYGAARNELLYDEEKSDIMTHNQMPSSYV